MSYCPLQIKHVKGHQDDKKPYYALLSLHTKLHISADALSNEYQNTCGKPHPKVLCFPKTRAHLYIHGKTITYKYKSAICNTFSVPALCHYFQKCNGWSSKTMTQIDWKYTVHIYSFFIVNPNHHMQLS